MFRTTKDTSADYVKRVVGLPGDRIQMRQGQLILNDRPVTRVALDHGIAVANAILTCDTPAQADERAEEKGRDAARVAVEMANLLDELS